MCVSLHLSLLSIVRPLVRTPATSLLRDRERSPQTSLQLAEALVPLRRPAPAHWRDRDISWSNPQGSVLTQVHDDVWLAERPFFPRLPGLQGTDVGGKMAVVRLPDGTLWVHSPVELDPALRDALAALGPVRHVVTPNTEHQKYASDWLREYPEATGYSCPGLRESKPEVGWHRSLSSLLDAPSGLTSASAPAEWCSAIELCWVEDRVPLTRRLPFFNEVVFFHRPSRSLMCADLWWNYPDYADADADFQVPRSTRLWKWGMDVVYKPVYNRLMKTDSWEESYRVIAGWEFETILPCHGEPVAKDAKKVLASHLAMAR